MPRGRPDPSIRHLAVKSGPEYIELEPLGGLKGNTTAAGRARGPAYAQDFVRRISSQLGLCLFLGGPPTSWWFAFWSPFKTHTKGYHQKRRPKAKPVVAFWVRLAFNLNQSGLGLFLQLWLGFPLKCTKRTGASVFPLVLLGGSL